MLEKLKKIGRSFMRAYEDQDGTGVLLFPIRSLIVAGMAASGAGGILFGGVGLFTGLACSALWVGGCAVGGYMAGNTRSREIVEEDCWGGTFFAKKKMVGPAKNVMLLKKTQERILSLTKFFKDAPQLPPKVEAKVQAYLQDAAEAAGAVCILDPKGWPLDEISFTRISFNTHGCKSDMVVGTVKTAKPLLSEKTAPVLASAPLVPVSTTKKIKIVIVRK